MLHQLRQWPHWPLVRYLAGLLTALATTATVGFGIWTYYQDRHAAAVAATQDRIVFEIVQASGVTGATPLEVETRYVEQLSADDAPTLPMPHDVDMLPILLRLAPHITPIADRWYVNSSEPLSNIKVFVEDILFGIPGIPDDYRQRSITQSEAQTLLAPILESDEIVTLTPEEVRSLNDIANASNQAATRRVFSDRTYGTSDIVSLFFNGFYIYYEYAQWKDVARSWSDFLADDSLPLVERLHTFVATELSRVLYNPLLLEGIVGMGAIPSPDQEDRDSSLVNLNADAGDCAGERSTNIRLEETANGGYLLDWGRSTSRIANPESRRLAGARQLGRLFENACAASLSRIFRRASEIFTRESRYIEAYIDEWNEIFTTRQPESLSMVVTISNLGAFDTYVRRDLRAGIGALSSNNKIMVTLTSSADDAETETGANPYLVIESRTPNTQRFRAQLDPMDSRSVHGAFNSGLNYVQVGVLASFGGPSEYVYSPVTPFSADAREQARQEVDDIPIEF